MKYFLVLGGFLGCALVFTSGLIAGNDPAIALRNSAIGCLAGASLLAGFRFTLVSCVRSVVAEKAKAHHGENGSANHNGETLKR